jgi:adenylate cyclase
MAEAMVHLDEALGLIEDLPEGEDKRRQEMQVQALRGIAITATRGYSAPEVGEAYERALDLSEAAGDRAVQVRALIGLYAHNFGMGRVARTREVSLKLLALAEESGDDEALLAAYVITGGNLSDAGKLGESVRYFERAIETLDKAPPSEALWMSAEDPGVVAWSVLGRNSFMLGYPDRAREALARARARGEEVRHAFSQAFALSVGASVLAAMRDWPAVERVSAEAAVLADEHRFPSWQVQAAIYHGLAQVKLGHHREGLAEIERGLALGEKIWVGGTSVFFLVALAEAGRGPGAGRRGSGTPGRPGRPGLRGGAAPPARHDPAPPEPRP